MRQRREADRSFRCNTGVMDDQSIYHFPFLYNCLVLNHLSTAETFLYFGQSVSSTDHCCRLRGSQSGDHEGHEQHSELLTASLQLAIDRDSKQTENNISESGSVSLFR
jgi:hypothetical protein